MPGPQYDQGLSLCHQISLSADLESTVAGVEPDSCQTKQEVADGT